MKRLPQLLRLSSFIIPIALSAVSAQVVAPTVHSSGAGGVGSVTGSAAFGSTAETFGVSTSVGPHQRPRLGASASLFDEPAATPRTDLSLAAGMEKQPPADTLLNGGASAALQAGPTVRAIHQYGSDARRQMVANLDERIDASAVAMARLHRQARTFDVQAQADFKEAAKTVEWREDQLRKSLKVAGKVSADSWADARAAVAADYASYAEAVARAEAVAHAHRAVPLSSPTPPPTLLPKSGTAPATKTTQATTTASTPPPRPLP